jgi:hypothetical protein
LEGLAFALWPGPMHKELPFPPKNRTEKASQPNILILLKVKRMFKIS